MNPIGSLGSWHLEHLDAWIEARKWQNGNELPIKAGLVKLIDQINEPLGEDVKQFVQPGACLKIVASCFSIDAFEALQRELAFLSQVKEGIT